ncbi:ABC transporter permease subunit [Pseudooceanicola sp. 216_PA32_1]|uniref:ABC transporter permease subunit n=1 Tax=Pseudooceanicola pacificus TaxID=2676438 RepID=A0A844WC14_9RHOB|nr:ABC transporter permease [Pseudooceanicola pacificus]MWB77632.1 ABC transporter permease subunit [Pseudooceanicola pacificus]
MAHSTETMDGPSMARQLAARFINLKFIEILMNRLIGMIVMAFSISVLVFLLIRLVPGDPVIEMLGSQAASEELAARLRGQLGLDKSLPEQYWNWITGVMHGDFGYSYGYQRPISDLVALNMPASIQLTASALFISVALGLLIGAWAAVARNRAPDTIGMGIAITFMSIPSFWLGLLFILLFAVQLQWFPVVGGTSLAGLVLPALTLGIGTMGFNARFVRSSLISTMGQNHVMTARAKGLSRPKVFFRHVMRNSMLPVLTVVGLQLGNLLSGTVVVETVFSRPGLGRLLVDAIMAKDYLTVQACVLIIALIYALSNLLVDLMYPILDPRIARR